MFGTDIENVVIIMGVVNGFPAVFQKSIYEFIEPLANRVNLFYNSN
jgi:hypothetical protein